MKPLYYAGLLLLAAFELANVYFIMPMPGSQRTQSVELAYVLYTSRWAFRAVAGLLIAAGLAAAFRGARGWRIAIPVGSAVVAGAAVWMFNFKMSADHMFREPDHPVYLGRADSKVDEEAVVIGVEFNGEARSYPVRYILYHHQVRDVVGGRPIMVTYCNVCRTGRVFDPVVEGRPETFRLVGMDHFNAMFEDATTHSWWRQVSGRAVTGPRRGMQLTVLPSTQMALKRWFDLHPNGRVMQPESNDPTKFDLTGKFERGESKSSLTRTDRSAWAEKSWVLGVEVGTASKAWDWNRFAKDRLIQDEVGGVPIVVALASDDRSFVAFERPVGVRFTLEHDELVAGSQHYDLSGRLVGSDTTAPRLKPIPASQEFWHSWRTFHPDTARGD